MALKLPLQSLFIFFCLISVFNSFSNASPSLAATDLGLGFSPAARGLFGRADEETEHHCTETTECDNGACCGASGWCGFGPTYCGDGCTSNCHAKAECGQYSETGYVQCPLNTCCSEFGFCGTSEAFCGSGCQSNCGNPTSPGSGGDVRSLVIGYYESWRANGGCGGMTPSQIPATAIDILNYAFVYIDPTNYNLVPMTPEKGEASLSSDEAFDLMSKVTATTLRNPNLKVWLAIGGWSFSDNNTATQPILGEIADNELLRNIFADHLVTFMKQYGFSGVDLDWEYPGAPDRGGMERDTANYPLLLQAIRKAFNGPRGNSQWGISITAPSSYWYLRWFDLPGIAEHVNFINLMSYDLHGIWDQDNELGAHVWAHTNLTEVDKALELFWRTGIAPELINLGIAFYGRTYKLSDASCDSPGCGFKGPGGAGDCTDTEGYLSYNEIMEKIEKYGKSASMTWDEEAGVKYMVYDSNNWLSYDDSTTFEQKVEFANARGLGGMLVWAIDQDDSSRSALRALTKREIDTQVDESSILETFDVSKCAITACGEDCPTGLKEMTRLNLDKSGKSCKNSGKNPHQRALCCPPWSAPQPSTCHWQNSCWEPCEDGTISLATDDYGESDSSWCGSWGKKSFCCPATGASAAAAKCKWTQAKSCPSSLPQEISRINTLLDGFYLYCCPKAPKWTGCEWAGSDWFCRNPQCPIGKMTMTENINSDTDHCYAGEQHSLCCDPPVDEAILPASLENLFPEYKEIPSEDVPKYFESLDNDATDNSAIPNAADDDPVYVPFAWVIIVGPEKSVQSLRKRDGSLLETFDCPDPALGDYGVQTLKAVCMAETDDHDCEDILIGGAYGTIIRLPEDCGPDEWVRVVSFEESRNASMPHELRKRSTSRSKIYEIKYDYQLRDVEDDEIFVRIDTSTHLAYWQDIVQSDPGKKRSESPDSSLNWRDEHYQWFHEHEMRKRGWGADSWWKDILNRKIVDGRTANGVHAKYEFSEVLYASSISCPPNVDAEMKIEVQGKLEAKLDWGFSLIGRLTDTEFQDSYGFFTFRGASVNVIPTIKGSAQITMETLELKLLENFDPWGASFNLKGLVTVGPSIDITARIDAIATLSGKFQASVNMLTGGFSVMFPERLGYETDVNAFTPRMYPTDTQIYPSYEVSVAAQGSISLEITPSVAFKVEVDLGSYVGTKALSVSNSHIRAEFPNRMVLGVGVGDSACDGLYYWMDYTLGFSISANASALGWTQEKLITNVTSRLKPHHCYPFSSDSGGARRSLDARADDNIVGANPLFPDPTGHHLACAQDTTVDADGTCPDWYDSDGNTIYACHSGTSANKARAVARRDAEYTENQRWFVERSLEKRGSGKDAIPLCPYSGEPRLKIDQISFPSSGQLISKSPNAITFGPDQPNVCTDFEFGRQPTPGTGKTSAFASEHILEHQTVKMFFETYTKAEDQNLVANRPNPASATFLQNNPKGWLQGQMLDLCSYMGFWWGMIPLRPTFTQTFFDSTQVTGIMHIMAKMLANSDVYSDELVLLYNDVNGMKEKAFGDYEDPLNVDACLSNPPDYEQLTKGLRKEVFVIRYLQLVTQEFKTQAERVADWLDGAENDLARFNDPNYNALPYVKLNIGNTWRKYVYEQAKTANAKLKGSLNRISEIQALLNAASNSNNNVAGGGTTTGATQQNQATVSLLQQIDFAYAGVGEWENPLDASWDNLY